MQHGPSSDGKDKKRHVIGQGFSWDDSEPSKTPTPTDQTENIVYGTNAYFVDCLMRGYFNTFKTEAFNEGLPIEREQKIYITFRARQLRKEVADLNAKLNPSSSSCWQRFLMFFHCFLRSSVAVKRKKIVALQALEIGQKITAKQWSNLNQGFGGGRTGALLRKYKISRESVLEHPDDQRPGTAV